MTRRHLGAALILVLAGLAYLNSFPGAFHYDDFPLMLENPAVTGESFRYTNFLDQYGGRPLTLWTFHLNHRFFGEEPFTYHLINVVLHGVAALAAYFLVLQMLGRLPLAMVAASIFALHPLQTQAVNYIWARSVLLMGCFGLLSLILVQRRPWASLGLLQLAIWSRTEALVLALPLVYRNPERWRGTLVLAGLNGVAFVYSVARYAPREVGWLHPEAAGYWLAQPAAFLKYLSLMIVPRGLSLDHGFSTPPVALALAAALAVAAFFAVVWRMRRTYTVPALALLWLGVMFLPSALVPNADFFSETRAYLPLLGYAVLLAWLVTEKVPGGWSYGASVLVLAGLLALTVQRNPIWNDDLALWEEAARKSPDKPRLRYNLGVALAKSGDFERARAEFAASRDLNPWDDLSYAGLGYCYEVWEWWEEARRAYQTAVDLNPRNEYARAGLERVVQRAAEHGHSVAEPVEHHSKVSK